MTLSRKQSHNSAAAIRKSVVSVLDDPELQETEAAFEAVAAEAERVYQANGTDDAMSTSSYGQNQGHSQSVGSVSLPPSRAEIARAVFTAANAGAVGGRNQSSWYSLEDEEIRILTEAESQALAALDESALQNYAYHEDEEQESFERLLRMHFPKESAAATASAGQAAFSAWSQTSKMLAPSSVTGGVRTPVEINAALPAMPATAAMPASAAMPAAGNMFVLNAKADTSRDSIAASLATSFGAMGLSPRATGATSAARASAASAAAPSAASASAVAAAVTVSRGKHPASKAYGERIKQQSLALKAKVQSAPYVEVNSEAISGATRISVNSMAQHLSAHLLPEALNQSEQESVSTVVTVTPPSPQAPAAEAEQTQRELTAEQVAAAQATAAMVSAVTAKAAAEEQANVKALSAKADPFAAALEQALLHPMSTKVAILDAVATAPQREQLQANPVGPKALGRSIVYSAEECGSDPVLNTVSPQVAAAVAAIAAEEQALEQKAAQASSELVQSITAQGHTVVTGRVHVPLESDSDSEDKVTSGVRIVRHDRNQPFVPSMEGVVSTAMSRRVQAHGSLAALGLRSSLNEAAATALGLDVSTNVLANMPPNALGMVNGTSVVNGTQLNSSAMHDSLSPLNRDGEAENLSLATTHVTTAPTVASWVKSWELNQELEQAGTRSDFSTATSRAALAALQSSEALASLQASLSTAQEPDRMRNEVLVRNSTTRIVTNSRRAKEEYRRGAQIVEAELAKQRAEQAEQEQLPATVISQYDVLVGAPHDIREVLAQDTVEADATASVADTISAGDATATGEATATGYAAITVTSEAQTKASDSAAAITAQAEAKAESASVDEESVLQPQSMSSSEAESAGASTEEQAETKAEAEIKTEDESNLSAAEDSEPVKTAVSARKAKSRTRTTAATKTRRTNTARNSRTHK
ncbi:MAG TPA: hypothetical protein H9850_08820 [Candidatus Anaerobiospirillum pullistercoris]|uniref:Uncharacterized protein n=1 Tax=Candidatus Anaerobiospirillum pullistercoris TaxID=2838452 RepID=A0A9D1WE84_9GAMM|nr:hypothetical protein [Candidatus Anaerobiospirillum pullistercoris]